MNLAGTVFHPELIELMKTVLEDATSTLPKAERTSTMKAEIAFPNFGMCRERRAISDKLEIAALSAKV